MQQELTEVYFYLKGTLKYRRVAVVLAFIVSIGAWLFVLTMPDKYESKAKVHIDSSTILRPLMRGMVIEPDVSALIRIIQQLMFTRPNLEKIVELSDLKLSVPDGKVSAEMIEKLKKDITITAARDRDIFDIGYSATSPDVAKSVVQAVLTVFSEQTQGKALADATDAQKFIEQQIREYEVRLQEAEKAKEDFKRSNLDLLSDDGQFQVLQRMKEQLQDADTTLQQAASRRDVLAEQVSDVQGSDEDWGVGNLPQVVSSEDGRIETLKSRRTDLLLKYTERHPEIVEIDKLIKTLQDEAKKQEPVVPEKDINEVDVISPKKMANPYVQALKMGFDNSQAEVASAQALVDSIKERIKVLELGFNERLNIETEMKNLNRDYETISAKFTDLLERREQARITEKVDDQTSRLKFRIADPPSRAAAPTSPNRKLFYSLIFLASLILGFAVAFLIYFIKPVFMSVRQVRVVTGLPSLGAVSMTNVVNRTAVNKDWIMISAVSLLLAGYTMFMLSEFLK
ncbi:MAG: hypothetical protein KGZ80_02325 [Methylomonas sp.]|nr:hypothetical protein [Methylomonas sp.]PPD19769.1 MAG: exosortase [Methylomonas sp.]PPD40989.1 MAG: exosortase [Methylomonas sp.]PPD53138.1 MAG: exosortase [Methylomonas sp.]